ncbi:hypothetical protein SAMN02927900_06445 [Rhizobium mongolense subsp. loessense]|uniref:Uncharacterized protein n=1 Tax=Rhizobium mongolense subsp. loessense TaxID=158890 RepID=A0A1G4U9Z4_9HYPH|nr:hypothetical protein SAMN02927900_06445 [Rhizobium mongolense subsp. loessense]
MRATSAVMRFVMVSVMKLATIAYPRNVSISLPNDRARILLRGTAARHRNFLKFSACFAHYA